MSVIAAASQQSCCRNRPGDHHCNHVCDTRWS